MAIVDYDETDVILLKTKLLFYSIPFTCVPVELSLETAEIVVKNLDFSPYTPSLNVKKDILVVFYKYIPNMKFKDENNEKYRTDKYALILYT